MLNFYGFRHSQERGIAMSCFCLEHLKEMSVFVSLGTALHCKDLQHVPPPAASCSAQQNKQVGWVTSCTPHLRWQGTEKGQLLLPMPLFMADFCTGRWRGGSQSLSLRIPLSASEHAIRVALVARGHLGSTSVTRVALCPSASESPHKQSGTLQWQFCAAQISGIVSQTWADLV